LGTQSHQTATQSSDTESRTHQVRSEQVKIVYRHLPTLLVVNSVVAGAMVFALWDVVAQTGLMVWGGAMVLVLAARAALGWGYRRTALHSPHHLWAVGFTAGAGATGVLWGVVGAFMFPADSLDHQMFILFILMGMGAGAITSLTAYMPALHAYLPISLLPISVVLVRIGDPIHIALGIMTFAYVAGLTFFARTINRAFIDSLSLRFENIDLVQALSEQRDEAERANIAKSMFLAAASHDLRQPLQSLTLFASALNERIKYPEVSKIVGNINASVHALEQLFNALLDISRLDAGVLQPAVRHFRLQELLMRLVNDYAPEAEQKGLKLECPACEFVLRSDPTLLERILRNFISNAVRYTEQGVVRVDGVVRGDRVHIEVTDSGIGIPLDQQHEIFSEFYQLGNPERDRTKGLGLGLAIVDRVARLLEHPIHVQSAPGQGSRFSVEVPLGDPQHLLADLLADVVAEVDSALSDLVELRVMIVDDEISIREGMHTLLEQWGCAVIVSGSEDEAVAVAREAGSVPEAIIADYRLRAERTGVQAIERLRHEFGSAIPALIMSGDTAAERLREARASGYQLVHKPVQPAMLRTFLRNVRKQQRKS
jgi:two-component system, sensor histidine kinase